MSDVEKERAKLLDTVVKTREAHEDAKLKYKAFCAENPEAISVNPTPKELQKMSEKLGSKTDETHAKSNAAHAKQVEKNKLIADAKGA